MNVNLGFLVNIYCQKTHLPLLVSRGWRRSCPWEQPTLQKGLPVTGQRQRVLVFFDDYLIDDNLFDDYQFEAEFFVDELFDAELFDDDLIDDDLLQ